LIFRSISMPKYLITSRAGRRVAGQRNTGVGTALELSEAAAVVALKAGEIVPVASEAKPKKKPASSKGA
jgi:hypothetical protein